ncbi:MAG: coproporphyrinogen dehydrogenase, partial [Oligoflexia bacterium]|nr:coproporphyrinogen dehydrogenase [Oligoflexia bacterium]
YQLKIKKIKKIKIPFKVNGLHLGGGTPNILSDKSFKKIVKTISGNNEGENGSSSGSSESGYEEHKLLSSIEIDPRITSIEQLELLYELNFRKVSFGIQDTDENVLRMVDRKQDIGELEQLTKFTKKIGFKSINFDLIYGLPGQTKESITKTARDIIRLSPDTIAFYSYAHVPWHAFDQHELEKYPIASGKLKRELYEIAASELLSNGYQAIGMDHFSKESDPLYIEYKKHNLKRSFMGYSCNYFNTIVGLGASAISSTKNFYVQNEKDLEKYQRSVLEKRKIPIVKYYKRTASDILIGNIIEELMIYFEVPGSLLNQIKNFKHYSKIMNKLDEFENDGLIKMTESFDLHVTELGKIFLRNIATAFDYHLLLLQINEQKFSNSL